MAVVLEAKVTNLGRDQYAKAQAGIVVGAAALSVVPQYFRVGEGGWTVGPDGEERRLPERTQVNLDCIQNPLRYPANRRYWFQKALDASDLRFLGNGVMSIRCFVGGSEANDNGFGGAPTFWEIGIYDIEDVMIAYGTYRRIEKEVGREFEITVKLAH